MTMQSAAHFVLAILLPFLAGQAYDDRVRAVNAAAAPAWSNAATGTR